MCASFDHERVDLKTKKTSDGWDYLAINPKGYVPALKLDSGEIVTENIAVLDWIVHKHGKLGADGPLGHTRLLEMLAFISSELHKAFKPLFANGTDEEQAGAKEAIKKRKPTKIRG